MEVKEKLARAGELRDLIETTETALEELERVDTSMSVDDRFYKDGCYNLCISEESDGSGWNLDLNRYYGNGKIISLIKAELKVQLAFLLNAAEEL